MHTWHSGSVRVNGLDMHYLRTGKGDQPPLVLAHGFTDNGRCWQRVALDLSADYDIIMPDARGHGLSGLPEVTFTQEDMANDLLEFIDALSLDKPGVMGHSMGANTASTAAALSPDRIGYLILEDPAWFPPPPDDATSRRNAFDWVYGVKTKTYDELVELCRRDEPNWHEIEIDAWAESKVQFNLGVMTHRTEIDPRAWPAVVARLRCPTLLITAEPGRGGIVSPETSAEVTQMSSHIQVVKIDDAGHSVHRDQFEATMSAVRDFLAKV